MKRFLKIISLITAFVLVLTCFYGCGAEKAEALDFPLDGDAYAFDDLNGISVHDPSLFKAEDGTYYIYGTHIASAKSSDLINWQTVSNGVFDNNNTLVTVKYNLRQTLAEPLSWCDGYQKQCKTKKDEWQTNIWASDVFYNKAMGKYCYYACSSVFGTPVSVIWFASSPNPEGPFEYQNALIYSGFNKLTKFGKQKYPTHYSFTNLSELIENGTITKDEVENAEWFDNEGNYDCSYGAYPNAIDPALFYDENGRLWMTYGSYSGGVYIMPLIEETGLPDYDYMRNTDGYDMYFGRQITKTNGETAGTGEGPYIVYDKEAGYYYLYLTYGGLGALDGYNIREYRSENSDGPYLDAMGNNALEMMNTGLKINGNYKFSFNDTARLSGGHSSCFIDDDGRIYQAYHQRFNDGTGAVFYDEIHQMLRTENGWHTMLPLKFGGETAQSVDYSDIVGNYEFIMFGNETTALEDNTDWGSADSIVEPTFKAQIRADGTLTIYPNGTDRSVTTDLYLKNNSYQFTFAFENAVYYGVFCKGTKDSGNEVMTLSAVADNNKTVWGVAE